MNSFTTNKATFIFQLVIYLLTVLLMGSINAIVDLFLHPHIPFFDEEHLIVGGVASFLTAILFGLVLFQYNRQDKMLQDQKRFENLLRASEKRSRSLIETIPLGVLKIDSSGTIFLPPHSLHSISSPICPISFHCF